PVMQPRTEVSCRAKALHTLASVMLWPLMAHFPLHPVTIPAFGLLERAAALRPARPWWRTEPVSFDGYSAEWVYADGAADDDGVVLYFHGGAFLFCGPATHRPAVAGMSRVSGMPFLSVAYRQLPEVPVRGSIQDCLTAYRHLLSSGYAPERIAFAGDSAGGYLAFATALQAAAEGLPQPGAIVAISPWLDLDCETKLSHPNARRDAYAPVARLPKLVEMLTEGVLPVDPLLSPVNHDLSVLPPSLLIAAEPEMLRCDSELMAERLAAAGVPTTLQIWDGQMHAFPIMFGLVPEAASAIREIGTFINRTLTAPATQIARAS
ncbi:MAG: alpha/beta hydrolase, partial [Micromonosporaceae bacterium]